MADQEFGKRLQKLCSDIWWIVLLRGLAAAALGWLLITRPGATLVVIVQFMGAYWIIDGVFTIVAALRGRSAYPSWGWGIFVGVVGLLAGLLVFSRPLAAATLTAMVLIYVLAFAALVSGISGIAAGIRSRKEGNREGSMILSGVLTTIFGLILFSRPLVSTVAFLWIIGIFAFIAGISLILSAFKIRKMSKASL